MSAQGQELDPQSWREIDASRFHVMIADDQVHLREIVGNLLRKEGYQVTLVEDGDELLRRAKEDPPDLVVLDVMMPRVDGLTALRTMREDPELCRAYVLILSGAATLEAKLEGFEVGADDYLTKPYSIDELRARVRSGIRLRAVERHLERSQQRVVRQEKLATIGVLASGIAHEFNNIMSGIAGFAQLAQRNPKFQGRLVEIALDQAKRAEKITSSLSTFASAASPRFERASILPLVEAAATLVKKSLNEKGATISMGVEPSLPELDINRGQIQQVLLQLLFNAGEAIGEGGQVVVRTRQETSGVILEVDDNGPGISPVNALRIFDPFFTTKGALGESEGEGTGLGLTFSLNVAEAHHGTIELVESQLGGACFRLCLPLPVGPPPSSVEGGSIAGDRETDGPLRLTMIEDDLTLQEMVCELLDDADITCFGSGPEALEHCRENPVDAVLLDMHLQGPWDGAQALEQLRTLPEPPPVILTTGMIEIAIEEYEYPQLELLRKPFRLTELEELLARRPGWARWAPSPRATPTRGNVRCGSTCSRRSSWSAR